MHLGGQTGGQLAHVVGSGRGQTGARAADPGLPVLPSAARPLRPPPRPRRPLLHSRHHPRIRIGNIKLLKSINLIIIKLKLFFLKFKLQIFKKLIKLQ